MWRGVWLFLLPAPAFALSPALSSMLPTLLEGGALIAGAMLVFHVSIAACKMMLLTLEPEGTEAIVTDFSKFSAVENSGANWSEMSTQLEFMLDPENDEREDKTLPDIDPALLTDYDDIDFIVAEDLDELQRDRMSD